jgi:two-component sensor histidine kinase/two-component SAPR family response regulator
MNTQDKVNILLVDDQPRKLLSYEVVLRDLQENLIKVSSAREALEQLLKSDIAVILIDVCMPDLDGFQLASMIREHPRFQQTAIIFVSAIHLNEVDFRRGYEMGAVDYVPVPVVPEVLRAKVKIFAELYRKTRALEKLNTELETRVRERTAELEASTVRLLQSEQRRDLALAAGNMGSWDWDLVNGDCMWDGGQYRIFGVDPSNFSITLESVRALIDPEDWTRLQNALSNFAGGEKAYQTEFRVHRPDGEWRWCMGTASATVDARGRITRLSGVTVDITDRKHTEERQNLLAREADHRAKNALAVVQSIVRLTKADAVEDYVVAVEGRIGALARAHTLLAQSRWQGADLATLVDEELAPYRTGEAEQIILGGPQVSLKPRTAQTIAVALHELATNAAKHGALASLTGRVALGWELGGGALVMRWSETGEPAVRAPTVQGFGIKVITSSVEAQLGGKARFDWRRDGMDCTLTIPHLDQGGPEARVPWQPNRNAPSTVDQPADARRVMIVEDEALIGMMMKDALTGLGLAVMGPFVTVGDAMRALDDDPVDFAILDVNLGGEWVYPVADRLATRGIPFVFVTGYGVDGLDGRFAQTPVFEKPIEPHVLESMFGRAPARRPASDATRWAPTSRAG